MILDFIACQSGNELDFIMDGNVMQTRDIYVDLPVYDHTMVLQSNIDITIGSGPPIYNDIARLSLYFGGTGVWDRK
jgi:hypothetical protein